MSEFMETTFRRRFPFPFLFFRSGFFLKLFLSALIDDQDDHGNELTFASSFPARRRLPCRRNRPRAKPLERAGEPVEDLHLHLLQIIAISSPP
jgi:hypothetical protein